MGDIPTGVALISVFTSPEKALISVIEILGALSFSLISKTSASAFDLELSLTASSTSAPFLIASKAIVLATPPQPRITTRPLSGMDAYSSAFKKPSGSVVKPFETPSRLRTVFTLPYISALPSISSSRGITRVLCGIVML